MPTHTTSQQDHELQIAVDDELTWTPDVDASQVGVAVHDGVVTLTGQVPSFAQKVAAGQAALRTRSVRAIANDLTVHHRGDQPTDTEIATAAREAIESSISIPSWQIKIEVRDRVVILTGEVRWHYQREAARKAVTSLAGIRGLDERISLAPRPGADATATETAIRRAIARQAALDASHVHVRIDGETVELTGTVSSWAEKRQAERAAWSSPHVGQVHNRIEVSR